ncbi:hypothetical protein [Isoptericola sp. NPDC056134]|uniref:hypothetical protein n=1 Tax=Isoptericola sp. NPDC056134 TaxID=3345723 RepID=UPI0035E688FA
MTSTPAVPERVRTAAYFILLGASALVLLATGLAPVWLDADTATRVVASGGVATSVFGLIAGGLGVAYRPTAVDPLENPRDVDPEPEG